MADVRPKTVLQLDTSNTLASNDYLIIEKNNGDGTSNTTKQAFSDFYASLQVTNTATMIGNTVTLTSNDTTNVAWLTIDHKYRAGVISFYGSDKTSVDDTFTFGQLAYAYAWNANTISANIIFCQQNGTNPIVSMNANPIIQANNIIFSFARQSANTNNVEINYTGTLFTP